MARGYIFEIDSDPHEIFTACDAYFNDYIGFEFDYATKVENPSSEITSFLEDLNRSGMETGYERVNNRVIPYFVVDDHCKKNYFQQAYTEFKKKSANLTLDDFLDGYTNWSLRMLLDDNYGDAVTSPINEFETLDNFMRSARGKYYIGSVFLMH